MGTSSEFKKHWFVTSLCTSCALIFLAALILSSVNYSRIIDARESIVLADARERAEELPNGDLVVGISVELRNPSAFDLAISSVSWAASLDVSGLGGAPFLPLATVYKSANKSLMVEAGETKMFEYEVVVSDPAKLSEIIDFINFSAAQGHDYTLETVPYSHDFRIEGWIGDFRHDYQYYGEIYLNDMVRIDLGYYEGEYL